MSKIVKSGQSYTNGHLPYRCSFYYLARARRMTWRVNLLSLVKDTRKQLARTSLKASININSDIL